MLAAAALNTRTGCLRRLEAVESMGLYMCSLLAVSLLTSYKPHPRRYFRLFTWFVVDTHPHPQSKRLRLDREEPTDEQSQRKATTDNTEVGSEVETQLDEDDKREKITSKEYPVVPSDPAAQAATTAET